ncbi:hypothetical protein WMY93_023207 [Mugilogobius chulae]|uniref:Beta-hexosaminidase subunit alpha n=1 Tax=Mugilogobius chulae TaxID=88201 RepID=A0AAW0NAH6_9GOBI
MEVHRCLLLLLSASLALHTASGVWPLPQSFTSSPQRFSLQPDAFYFTYGPGSAAKPGCSVLDEAFKRYFRLIFPDYNNKQSFSPRTLRDLPFTLAVSVKQDDCEGYPTQESSESYNLTVSAGQGALNAETVWGALRGLESFSQLVYQDNSGTYYINKTDIEDFARFPFRGILLDTSRHYLPLKAIFQTLGAYHPETHIYTQTDVQAVISYARMRGIRVLPEFDSPGHTQSWGKGQPDLLTPCYSGSSPSGQFGPVNPSLNSTFDFMSRLLKEVSKVFPDSYIHLGGDEVDFTCWKTNPDIKAFMQSKGFGSDFTKLEAFYMESIVNMTTALNRTAIVWQDVFDYHEKIPKSSVLHIWKGLPPAYYAEMEQMTQAGMRVILAAPWYINHINYGQDWRTYYGVEPLNFNGTEEQKKLVIGGEVCMWGEYIDATNLTPRLWPRGSAAAERLWSDEKQTTSVDKAFPRLQDFRCKLLRQTWDPGRAFVCGSLQTRIPGDLTGATLSQMAELIRQSSADSSVLSPTRGSKPTQCGLLKLTQQDLMTEREREEGEGRERERLRGRRKREKEGEGRKEEEIERRRGREKKRERRRGREKRRLREEIEEEIERRRIERRSSRRGREKKRKREEKERREREKKDRKKK